jgi:hypothetical protein
MSKAFNWIGRSLAASALVAFFCVANATAQVTTSTVTGRVVDGQGNVVPGAKITVTSRATGSERIAMTNGDGEYTVPAIPPGRYSISAEAQSFSRALVEDVELNVGSRQNFNFDLRPGNITETVNITAEQPLVETTKSEIGITVSPKEIENLPLINRTFAGLTAIAPEARPVGNFDPTKTRIGNVAFNGGDGRSVNVNIDGGDNKDNVVGSLLQNFSYESIQEFQIQQHRWSADQGRAIGGVVNVITKSGGNEFHGSVFANFRDRQFQRRDYFEKLGGRDVAPFQRQEYGGSIGGPIPTFGFGEGTPFRLLKDRAFFFFALEKFRERQIVPVFGDVFAQIQAIPGSQPVPEIPTPYDDMLMSAKIDVKINDKQNMNFRYSNQDQSSPNDQISPPVARTDLSGGNTATTKAHSFVANHVYNVAPNVLNQFSFHFQDFQNYILALQEGLTLSFPAGGFSIGQNPNVPQATLEKKYQFKDDLTVTTGNHTMKFGVNYINTTLDGFFYFGVRGYSVAFNGLPTAIRALPQGFATPGIVQTLQYSDGASSHLQKIDQLAFYGQDDWKITRNLTLNLGLRWDANFGNLPAQDRNRTILLLSQLNHPRARAITQDAEKLKRTTPSLTEFQPRVGFAWDPFGDAKTVIRGGYGIYYDQIFQNLSLFSQVQSEPQVFQTAINLINTPGSFLSTFRYGVDPLPAAPPASAFANLIPGSVGRINDPDATEPYIQKFSIGFQRELMNGLSISSDYVHTLGLYEPRFMNINPTIQGLCNPQFPGSLSINDPSYATRCPRGAQTREFDPAFVAAGLGANRLSQINMFATNNRSLFDSWTTTVKYRTSKITMNASYVLASSRSWGGQPVASYSGNGIAITPERQFVDGEYGPSRIDERHRIVLSGVFTLPWNFQISPIVQYATARPYSPTVGFDIDGDGLATLDRLCSGVDPLAVFNAVRAVRTQGPTVIENTIRALNPRGCAQQQVNSFRNGFITDAAGNITGEGKGRFFNVDVKVGKVFKFGERFALNTYVDLYNVFDTENLNFTQRLANSPATGAAGVPPTGFLTPQFLFGPGFGPPVGRPLTAQFGARFTF